MNDAYSPPRHIIAKWNRRHTQARPARPAELAFAQGVLSVCFDDFPHSAAAKGARILEAHGARGTFYASASLVGQDGHSGPYFTKEDLEQLGNSGHEIGCHGYSHADYARREVYDTLIDLAKNRDAMAALGHYLELQALAYPYGETTFALKSALPPRYRTARGVNPGLNVGRVDLAQLKAYKLYGEGIKQAKGALKSAARRKAWMIVFTHDVAAQPSPWGIAPDAFDDFLAAAKDVGLAILPVTQALDQATVS